MIYGRKGERERERDKPLEYISQAHLRAEVFWLSCLVDLGNKSFNARPMFVLPPSTVAFRTLVIYLPCVFLYNGCIPKRGVFFYSFIFVYIFFLLYQAVCKNSWESGCFWNTEQDIWCFSFVLLGGRIVRRMKGRTITDIMGTWDEGWNTRKLNRALKEFIHAMLNVPVMMCILMEKKSSAN